MSVAEPKLPHLGNLIPREEADNRAEPVACRQKPGIARQLIRRASANLLFIFCFAVPVMLTAIYYLFDASSMYISELRIHCQEFRDLSEAWSCRFQRRPGLQPCADQRRYPIRKCLSFFQGCDGTAHQGEPVPRTS